MARGEVLAVREARHGKAPHLQLRLRRDEARQVALDDRVGDARTFHVQSVVVRLVVGQPHVNDGQQRLNRGGRRVERRVEAGVEPRRLEPREKLRRPFPEEERLAARERDAAAGGVVERPVLQRLGDERVLRPRPPVELERPRRARRLVVRAVRTVPAEMLKARLLRLRVDGLGIVAPDAAERTPLHEERRAQARPVVDGHALDVQHQRRLERTRQSASLPLRAQERHGGE